VEFLTQLWLPIVVSAVAVFILSALAWTVMPHHKKDFTGLPNADAVQAVMRQNPPVPGQYAIPWVSDMKMLEDPAVKAKMEQGPRAYITVVPNGMPSMGPMLAKSFIFYLFVSLLVGYVSWHALGAGAEYLAVFRFAGTTASMAYILATVPDAIWFGRPWGNFGRQALDGLVFALFTAGVFGWLWPR
jgi:hypothetical protein